ncbi:hypothetical protein BDV95DRAFT_632417 [Massariosphaeria phaeospora]|uniref:Helicase C-terminal domain-containing protein n=1 Tax=Massariosphaeria phaeospora TaxID=100035 RepID=A0A7C8I171_9PLEO|nr:hypothetical protein BDV95DRAFT_632417 [Massariosphaeria phaeospora]
MLEARDILDRIVINECYIVLNRQYTFRKQMQQLGRLVAAKTQIVMLTATLPLTLTARTNIAYRIVKLGKEAKRQEAEAIVLRAVRQKLRKYKTSKIIVYSNLVPKAYYYHAVSKAGMLEEFIASRQRIIVATSALGTSVDVPDIRCIVYIN